MGKNGKGVILMGGNYYNNRLHSSFISHAKKDS